MHNEARSGDVGVWPRVACSDRQVWVDFRRSRQAGVDPKQPVYYINKSIPFSYSRFGYS